MSDVNEPGGEQAQPATRKRRRLNGSVLLAGVLAIAAFAWIASGNLPPGTLWDGAAAQEENGAAQGKAASAEPEKKPVTVRVFDSTARERQAILRIAGRTEAARRAVVRAETAGRVAELKAAKGDRVSRGDAIARIALGDRQARLEEARALVDQRTIEFEAASRLANKGFQSEIRRSETKALLDSARASLSRIEKEIADTVVTAPFDGVIDRRPVELGDYLSIGDLVAEVIDIDPMMVVAAVSEREIAGVELGALAHARLITGEEVEGVVSFIAPAANPETRTFRVEIEVAETRNRYKDGLTAEVSLPVRRASAHLISPALLTLADDGTVGVKTVEEDRTVRFRPVSILEDAATGMWVVGLPPEVRLITVGQEYVVQGETVEPVPDTVLMPATLRAAGVDDQPS